MARTGDSAASRAVVVTADGGLVAYSASGAGAQYLDAAAVDAALEEGKTDLEAERALMEPREPEDRLPTGAGEGE